MAPDLQHTLALLRSFTLGRERVIYQNTWLVLDSIDGLRDASDLMAMRKIFNDLTGIHFKGCYFLMSMKNDYYQTLRRADILNTDNHRHIQIDPNTFPLVYEDFTRRRLQRSGYSVPGSIRRQLSSFIQKYVSFGSC